ncbi:Lrp/AsnC family transcriptional regulator [Candidatus Bathyarchaeota archaeon]|nr:Lrp/AsnC family transcriptional regulator [Candidatus Bathyarchaeota archaeon]
MVSAYILGRVEKGSEMDVLNSLKKSEYIKKGSLIYGPYDFCIEAQFETIEELDAFIFNFIRKIPGVKDTCTLIVARAFSKE